MSDDGRGRVFQHFDGSPDHGGLRSVYNARGYQTQLYEAADPATVHQTIHARDAFGNITHETLGNGVVTRRLYDERSFLRQIRSGSADGNWNIQDLALEYDGVGNLMERHDDRSDQHEVVQYDVLDRLMWVDVTLPGQSTPIRTMQMSYDSGGRIISKEGIAYSYDSAVPVHAVKGRASETFTYDETGNQTHRTGGGQGQRTLDYTHFDKPWCVSLGNTEVESLYTYDASRNRIEREDRNFGSTHKRTWYLGSVKVVVDNPTAPVNQQTYHYRRQIDGIGQVEFTAGQTPKVNYYHRDHLGSLDAVTFGTSSNPGYWLSYDAFGRRRNADDWSQSFFLNPIISITDHGDHEMRDEFGFNPVFGTTNFVFLWPLV